MKLWFMIYQKKMLEEGVEGFTHHGKEGCFHACHSEMKGCAAIPFFEICAVSFEEGAIREI